MLKNIIKMV